MKKLAIVMEGGIVSAVVSNDADVFEDIEIVVIDYDIEGFDDTEVILVPQRDGSRCNANCYRESVVQTQIELDTVFEQL